GARLPGRGDAAHALRPGRAGVRHGGGDAARGVEHRGGAGRRGPGGAGARRHRLARCALLAARARADAAGRRRARRLRGAAPGGRCVRALHRRPRGGAVRADGSARARGDLLRAAAEPGGGGRRGRRGEGTGRARRAAQRGDRLPGGGRRSGARGARGRLIRRPSGSCQGPPGQAAGRTGQAWPLSTSWKWAVSSGSTGSAVSSRWVIGAARRVEESSQAPSAPVTSSTVISSSPTANPSWCRWSNRVLTLVPGSTPALTGVVRNPSPRRTISVDVGPSST